MDPLTHALSGALLARATASAKPRSGALPIRTRVAAGFVAAAFPDIDFGLRLIDTLTYLNWHQGVTHSMIMLPAWALMLAHVFSRVDPGRHGWRVFYGPACLGIAIHIAGDLITAYGLMLFAPLSTRRFSLPLAFVIDPWLTAIIASGLLGAAFLWQGRLVARIALIVLLMYAGFLAAQQHRALGAGETHLANNALADAKVHALPQPLSPFNWKVVIVDGEDYHMARIRFMEGGRWHAASMIGVLRTMRSAYHPPTQANWRKFGRFGDTPATAAFAREAWHQPGFSGFRRFAVFPLLERIDEGEAGRCAWFVDMRFVLPAMPPSFRYGMCRDDSHDWHLRRARGAFWID